MAAFSFNGINFRESTAAYVSPEEAWGQDDQKITAEWMINWTDRQNVRVALLGTSNVRSQATPAGSWLTPPATGNITGTATGGSWSMTISVSGGTAVNTGLFAWNISAADLQDRIQGLTNIGVTNCTVTGTPGNWHLVFAYALGPVVITINNTGLISGPYVASAGSIAYISRTLPHLYPDPAANWLYARSVLYVRGWATPKGKNAGTSIMDYSDAKVGVLYGGLPYNVLSDVEITNPTLGVPDESSLLRFVYRAAPVVKEKVLTFNRGSWQWVDTSIIVAGAAQPRSVLGPVGVIWCTTILEYVWYAVPVPGIPTQTIINSVGNINVNAFDGNPAGTLLLKSPRYNYYRLPDGQRGADVHYFMEANPKGWSNFPDPERENEFHPIGRQREVRGPVHNTPYHPVDFAPLFRPSLTG